MPGKADEMLTAFVELEAAIHKFRSEFAVENLTTV